MLRASFPVDVLATNGLYDIQFGCLERPAHANTTWDMAKDEVPAQQWADLSDAGGYGVALLNDSKHGYRIKDGLMELALLRSAKYPRVDPRVNVKTDDGFDYAYSDQRDFRFAYALFPHAGDAHAGGVDREAAAFNMPLRLVPCERGRTGETAASHSFVEIERPNICVSTLKKAEDGDAPILRLYENAGRRTRTGIRFGFPVQRVEQVNLMEERIQTIGSESGGCVLDFAPFEIVTLKLT
jgi:alpha-mannosidase